MTIECHKIEANGDIGDQKRHVVNALGKGWHKEPNDGSFLSVPGQVIMGAMAAKITGVSIVYSTISSGEDQRKHQMSTSLAFVRGRWRGKYFHLVTSSWNERINYV